MKSIVLLCFLAGTFLFSQQSKQAEGAKNLRVLPKDISGEQLTATMKGFTRALGVRCNFCHVGEDGKPLSEFDFPSDQIPMKSIARDMLRLTTTINTQIKEIFYGGTEIPIEVTCATCHHGSIKPQRIEDILWAKYEKAGIEQTVALYRDMRKKYYGSYTYDFREGVLITVANTCEREKKMIDHAVLLLELNAEFFPDSPRTLTHLASLYVEKKEPHKAKPLIAHVLAIDPNNEFAKRLQSQIGN